LNDCGLTKRIMSFRDAVDAGKVGDRERVSLRWGSERRFGRVAKTLVGRNQEGVWIGVLVSTQP
jgi:hypothetical protein